MRLMIMTVLLASTVLLGCDGKSTEKTTSDTEAFIDIPDSTFLAQRPAEAKDLVVIKKDAKIGDQVTFLARVGGRARPFVEKQAIFIAADPWRQEEELTVRQVLDRGRDRIADQLADQPRVRGRLLNTLGAVYDGLSHHREAEELHREALEVNEAVFGSDSGEVAQTSHRLGVAVHRQGRLASASASGRPDGPIAGKNTQFR